MNREILTMQKICSLVQSNEYEVYLMRDRFISRVKKYDTYWEALYNRFPSGAEMVVYLQPVPKPTPPVTAEVIVDGRTYRLVEES